MKHTNSLSYIQLMELLKGKFEVVLVVRQVIWKFIGPFIRFIPCSLAPGWLIHAKKHEI